MDRSSETLFKFSAKTHPPIRCHTDKYDVMELTGEVQGRGDQGSPVRKEGSKMV
jgi:hypothetical protein